MMPTVSVIFCVYNGLPFLNQAVDSILNQTFEDFEIVFLNDGSTDGSKEVMLEYARKDPRVQYHEQENQGLTKSLNTCLRLVKGDFIARHDADDYSHVTRFQKQVEFMRRNPRVGILGTHFCYVDDNGRMTRRFNLPTSDAEIRRRMQQGNQFAHGSVMLRREVLDLVGTYSDTPEHQYIEDYEFWVRIMRKFQGANIPEILYYYRPNRPGSVCARFGSQQKTNHFKFLATVKRDGLKLER